MRQRAVVSVLAFGAVVIAAIASLGWLGGFRLNATPSYPLGLWRIEQPVGPIKVGDLVFICMPDGPGLSLGLERGYLRAGLCPSGAGPLIKTIAAVPGAHVHLYGKAVSMPGRKMGHVTAIADTLAEAEQIALTSAAMIKFGSPA